MRRLPLALLMAALPAAGQSPEPGAPESADAGVALEPAIDAGAAPDAGAVAVADAGVPQPRVGRHFAFVWDAEGPKAGDSDVQLWLTPRWGRPEQFIATEVRAGVRQGFGRGFAVGFFLDTTPTATGVTLEPSVDARLTLNLHEGFVIAGPVHAAAQVELSGGPSGGSFSALLAADAQLGAFRVGLNADVWTNLVIQSGAATFDKTRARQTLGLSYTLTNGFSAGVEMQNRLTWNREAFGGAAFLIGPAIAFRGEQLWCTITLLPQVAAVKPESRRGVGDPLELTDNERFTLRLSLGIVP